MGAGQGDGRSWREKVLLELWAAVNWILGLRFLKEKYKINAMLRKVDQLKACALQSGIQLHIPEIWYG